MAWFWRDLYGVMLHRLLDYYIVELRWPPSRGVAWSVTPSPYSFCILIIVAVQLNWSFINGTWQRRLQLTPSVALAVTNTVSNLCLAIAIVQGVAIAWWRKVGRKKDSKLVT